ncbi:MAG: ATP-dependent DNA helicase, partial [Haloarculaceae archaeon]
DHGATYLADSSLLDLFERARTDMPGWFAEQVDRLSTPDLPAFDPRAAVAEVGGDVSGRDGGSAGGRSGGGPATRSRSGSGSRSGAGSGSDSGSAGGSTAYDDHPLSDVWGE